MSYLDEDQVEIVTVDCFREPGYVYIHGGFVPDGKTQEPLDYAQWTRREVIS